MKPIFDILSNTLSATGQTLKSIIKIIAQSRTSGIRKVAGPDETLIIMGNGPSLSKTIADKMDVLTSTPTMAVNFAANSDEFFKLRPKYYILADPHFFRSDDTNVNKLHDNLSRVDWDMTLLIPAREQFAVTNSHISIMRYNPVGVEGFQWFTNMVYAHGLGMPRPRNVLIPAIMTGISLGYKKIFIVGADHSWTSTLSVNEENEVISIQPHFYKETQSEQQRVKSVYKNIRLHEVIHSFYVAFKSYHHIKAFAKHNGVTIINATPGSFIDAFHRGVL